MSLSATPDTQVNTVCQSECCACNAAASNCVRNATTRRIFDLSGSIYVDESIEYIENGACRERSEGISEKN